MDPNYWSVSLSTVTAAEGPRFTFSQVQAIATQPNYIQQSSNHFFLAPATTAKDENKRMNQALINLSQNILNFILQNFLPHHQHVPVKSLVQKKESLLSQPHLLPSEEKLSIPQKSVFKLSSTAARDQSNVNSSYSYNLRSYAKKDPISSPFPRNLMIPGQLFLPSVYL